MSNHKEHKDFSQGTQRYAIFFSEPCVSLVFLVVKNDDE